MQLFTAFSAVLLLLITVAPLSAADTDDPNSSSFEDDFNYEGPFDELGLRKPTMFFTYGSAAFNAEGLTLQPADAGMAELQIGFSRAAYIDRAPNIAFEYYDGFTASYISSAFGPSLANDALDLESWRFGPSSRQGLGYKLGKDQNIILFNGSSISWSNINLVSTPLDVPLDSLESAAELRTFTEGIRFGTRFEGGFHADILPTVAIEARYERSIVFRRHKFWKWAGSSVMEYISQEMVDGFVGSVMRSNPDWAPVISFVLKNSLSYAWYELRQDEMNWPFGGEAPLATDAFKLGLVLKL